MSDKRIGLRFGLAMKGVFFFHPLPFSLCVLLVDDSVHAFAVQSGFSIGAYECTLKFLIVAVAVVVTLLFLI